MMMTSFSGPFVTGYSSPWCCARPFAPPGRVSASVMDAPSSRPMRRPRTKRMLIYSPPWRAEGYGGVLLSMLLRPVGGLSSRRGLARPGRAGGASAAAPLRDAEPRQSAAQRRLHLHQVGQLAAFEQGFLGPAARRLGAGDVDFLDALRCVGEDDDAVVAHL